VGNHVKRDAELLGQLQV